MIGRVLAAGIALAAAVVVAAAPSASADIPGSPSGDLALSGKLSQGGWARGVLPQGFTALSLDGKPVPVAADGQFLIGFDRDAAALAKIVLQDRSGRIIERSLAIAPRAWQIEHVPVALRPGSVPSASFLQRRQGELAQIAAARSTSHAVAGWRQDFIWPVKGRISGRFGSQRIYKGTPGAYHSGLDIATGASGTPFVAPADGVVVLAASTPFSLEGNLLMIDHGMGLNSAFLHASSLAVKVGDVVRQGQYIGNIGATGRASGPHLHWSIKWNDARLDPLQFVQNE